MQSKRKEPEAPRTTQVVQNQYATNTQTLCFELEADIRMQIGIASQTIKTYTTIIYVISQGQ
jgi:hypothetical protein